MSKISIKPLADSVIVGVSQAEEKTASGIIIPDTAKEKPQKGIVASVGPGDRDDQGKHVPMDVNAGDTVLFNKYSGTEIKIDSKKLLILRESDLLAIVEE